MAVRISLDDAEGWRTSLLSGVVTDAELNAAYEALVTAPDYDPSLDDLVDATGVVRVEVTPEGVREVARVVAGMDAENPGTRVAIVARGGAAYVMARLYGFYREAQGAPAEHKVFQDLDAARVWLREAR